MKTITHILIGTLIGVLVWIVLIVLFSFMIWENVLIGIDLTFLRFLIVLGGIMGYLKTLINRPFVIF